MPWTQKTRWIVAATVFACAIACAAFAGWCLMSLVPTDDCGAQNMTHLDRCEGEDNSWQECRYYLRGFGTPDRAFCQAMLAGASNAAAYPTTPACVASSAWNQYSSCDLYGLDGWPRCFVCAWRDGFQSSRLYAYAFTDDCASGAVFVTCNFGKERALELLGPFKTPMPSKGPPHAP